MPFFTIPYQICFEDTMAYGSHHYLTNFRFQCAIREALYFKSGVNGQELWKEDLANVVLLTYEGYSRNLAPLGLGDRVALLLTVGESTRSSMQLCLRAVSADGTPVTVGYQRFLCTARDTRQPLPLPPSMTQYAGHLDEPLMGPRFEELARKGGRALDTLFPPEVRALGRAVTAARDGSARFLTASGQEALILPGPDYEPPGPQTALLLPGQGGYDWPLLRELYLSQPELREHFRQADAVARSILGQPFLPLVLASTKDQHDRELARFPELDQLGIFLLSVLLATLVQQRGLQAPVVLGHSVGEVAALAVAGALRIEEGLEVICRRIAALQALGLNDAGMAALSCDQAQAESAIAALAPSSLQLAVINHSRQTVASGRRAELLALGEHLAPQGVTATLLKSRYPYHCRMLAAAVGPFAVGIDSLRAGPLRQRLFSPADGRYHQDGDEVLRQLPLHLVRRLDFQGGVRTLYERGVRTFVQCGAGDALAKIVHRALDASPDLRCVGGPLPGEALPAALERMAGLGSVGAAPAPLATTNPPRPEVAEHPLEEPIAIIGMGCVLPGAADVLTVQTGVDLVSGGTNQALRVSGTSNAVAIESAAIVAIYDHAYAVRFDLQRPVDGAEDIVEAQAKAKIARATFKLPGKMRALSLRQDLDDPRIGFAVGCNALRLIGAARFFGACRQRLGQQAEQEKRGHDTTVILPDTHGAFPFQWVVPVSIRMPPIRWRDNGGSWSIRRQSGRSR